MKSKKIIPIFILIVFVLITLAALIGLSKNNSEQCIINDFLQKAFTKSDENMKMYNNIHNSATIIGEGVDRSNDQLNTNSGIMDEIIKEEYGSYLNDQGITDFQSKLYSYLYLTFSSSQECTIDSLIVEDKDGYYSFQVILNIDNNIQTITGRLETTDKKISRIIVSEIQ